MPRSLPLTTSNKTEYAIALVEPNGLVLYVQSSNVFFRELVDQEDYEHTFVIQFSNTGEYIHTFDNLSNAILSLEEITIRWPDNRLEIVEIHSARRVNPLNPSRTMEIP